MAYVQKERKREKIIDYSDSKPQSQTNTLSHTTLSHTHTTLSHTHNTLTHTHNTLTHNREGEIEMERVREGVRGMERERE